MAYQTYALKDYNSASTWQLNDMLKCVDSALKCLKWASELTNGPIKIVDYGCSEGLNSSIFFYELIKKFRNISNQTIEILHDDLPSNNWNAFFNTINNNNPTYLQLENVYYSALGKSFYNNIVAPQSVHFGFSSYSFHYLSQRSIRKEGEKGPLHSGFLEQLRKDMESLIRERINELVPGGTFYGILLGNAEELDQMVKKINFGGIAKLLELGYITQEELDNFEFSLYPIAIADLEQILQKFSNEIEVLELKIEKSFNPYYSEYLKDNDLEKYANSLADFFEKIITPTLVFNFPNKNLSNVYREEVKKIILGCYEKEINSNVTKFMFKKITRS